MSVSGHIGPSCMSSTCHYDAALILLLGGKIYDATDTACDVMETKMLPEFLES